VSFSFDVIFMGVGQWRIQKIVLGGDAGVWGFVSISWGAEAEVY